MKSAIELELGSAAHAAVTQKFLRDLVGEVLASAQYVLVLKKTLSLKADDSPPSRRHDIDARSIDDLLETLYEKMRRGFISAIALCSADEALRVLRSRGYQAVAKDSVVSAPIVHNWTAWLSDFVFMESRFAIVFGHDYQSVFLFEQSACGERR